MAKVRKATSRKVSEEPEVAAESPQCTSLDHLYPLNPTSETRCYCGKRVWKTTIKLDDYLQPGQFIRTVHGGPIYEVEMVNESRARCRLTSAQQAVAPRLQSPEGEEEEERRGRIINISPQSAVIRVSAAELQQEARVRSVPMAASKVASLPVAGSSKSTKNLERLMRLSQKPPSTARPLSGAAARAKANANGKPKAEKTVRPCGCGCNGETTAFFVPGHDARYKGWMKRVASGEMPLPELKKLMGAKTFGKYTFKKKGDGHVPQETYQEAAGA